MQESSLLPTAHGLKTGATIMSKFSTGNLTKATLIVSTHRTLSDVL